GDAKPQLYDSATGLWSDLTPASGVNPVGDDTWSSTLLADGRVLVLGNETSHDVPAQIFDPKSKTFTLVASPPTRRRNYCAARLPGGAVLVSGGTDASDETVGTVEIFDPNLGTWSSGPPLHFGRWMHACHRLPDGRILVVGGDHSTAGVRVAETYDPV